MVTENPPLIALALLLLVGTISGALFARGADDSILQRLDLLFTSNVKARVIQSSDSASAASPGSSLFFIVVCFLLGTSLWGAFVLPLVSLSRGFGFSLASDHLYSVYGFQRVLFSTVMILPDASSLMITILPTAKGSILFSKEALLEVLRREQSKTLSLKGYAIQFDSFLILSTAVVAIDLITTVYFIGVFSF